MAKQKQIPGMEDPVHKDIDVVAAKMFQAKNKKAIAATEYKNASEAVEEKMVEHGLKHYRHDGILVTVTDKSKIEVEVDPDEE